MGTLLVFTPIIFITSQSPLLTHFMLHGMRNFFVYTVALQLRNLAAHNDTLKYAL